MSVLRVDWWVPCELGWYLDHGLVDEYGHRIQVTGVGFQAQPLCLQGYASATGEGVVEGGELVRVEQLALPWDDLCCPRRCVASSYEFPGAPIGERPRWWCFPTSPAPQLCRRDAGAPAIGPPRLGTTRDAMMGHPPVGQRAPHAPPPTVAAPTKGAACWGGRAGWTSLSYRRRALMASSGSATSMSFLRTGDELTSRQLLAYSGLRIQIGLPTGFDPLRS